MNAKKKLLRLLPFLIGMTIVSGVAGGMVLAIKSMLEKPPQTKKFVQKISLIKPPPPPPPKIEKPPEPKVEKVKLDKPKPEKEEMPKDALKDLPPPGDQLGLDADGGAGSDGFGLLGRKGGRGLLEGLNSTKEFEWYTSPIASDIQNYLADHPEVKKGKYTIDVKLWLNNNGTIKSIRLADSTGDKKIDKNLQIALAEMTFSYDAPPENMPQPIRLRIKHVL